MLRGLMSPPAKDCRLVNRMLADGEIEMMTLYWLSVEGAE
jgi:hypothetical protein